jgi:hypothetical protein
VTPIDPSRLSILEWRQPETFKRMFELYNGDILLARLAFPKMFGSLAEAQTARTTWSFKRTGFFSPRVTARLEGTAEDVAFYEPNFTGSKGVLHLQGGELLRLQTASFWATEWTLIDAAKQPLIRFHNKGVFRHAANVDVFPAAQARHDVPLLLTLTWYVLLLYIEDAASAATVTAG